MRVSVFSTKPYDREYLTLANEKAGSPHELGFFEPRLTEATAALANGSTAVCTFVLDTIDAPVIKTLADGGVKLIALRCAGFNQVDLQVAEDHGIKVVRVPAYSPYAVAEHAVALILTLNRKVHRAFNRVREGNFALEGLLGFDLHGKTVGVVGTGKIGHIFADIMRGFGCNVIAYDLYPSEMLKAAGVEYVEIDALLAQSDIVSLHCPLTPETHHIIDASAISNMKPGVMLINTSRGGLVDTAAVIDGLKTGRIGNLALDVYEEEGDMFYEDLSSHILRDDVFARLLTFSNVLITGHQAFFTREALANIGDTTISNLSAFEGSDDLVNEVKPA